MKSRTIIASIFTVMISSCLAQSDIDCVKKINSIVLTSLRQQSEGDVPTRHLELIIAIYSDETDSNIDSIAVHRSNLDEMGFDQGTVIKSIKEMKDYCLSGLYNKDGLKPDYVIYRFNPEVTDR